MNRRGFLRGLIAMPAIVAVSNIMPVRSVERFLAPDPHKLILPFTGHFKVGDIIRVTGMRDQLTERIFRIAAVSDHSIAVI